MGKQGRDDIKRQFSTQLTTGIFPIIYCIVGCIANCFMFEVSETNVVIDLHGHKHINWDNPLPVNLVSS